MNVIRIQVLQRRNGPDIVILYTDTPCAMSSDEYMSFDGKAPRGKGAEYARKHFPGVYLDVTQCGE